MTTRTKWVLGTVAAAIFLALLSAGIEARKGFDAQLERNHLIRDLRIVCYLFRQDNDGAWPPLSAKPPRFMYDPAAVRTAYSIDKTVQGKIDSGDPAMVMGFLHGQKAYSLRPLSDPAKYVYLGYAVTNETEGLALVEAVRNAKDTDFSGDLPAPAGKGTLGADHFARLNTNFDGGKSGDEAAKLRARIPAIIERPITDGPTPGGWVVYLDEHTEFVPYPGPFPMTEAFIDALEKAE